MRRTLPKNKGDVMATLDEVVRAMKAANASGDMASARKLAQVVNQAMGGRYTSGSGPRGENLAIGPAEPPPLPVDVGAGYLGEPSPRQSNRFGDTTGKMMEGPLAAAKAYGRGVIDQSQSPTMQSLPDWVPEWTRGGVARTGDAAMAALSGLGAGFAGATGAVSEIIAGDQTQEARLGRDLTMMGQVAVPELAGVSSIARAAGGAAAAGGRSANVSRAQATARAANDLGITPALGMNGKVAAMTAAGLEKVPLTGGIIARDAARAVDQVEGAFRGAVRRVGAPRSSFEAGETLQSGLQKFVDGFKKKSGELYNAIDSHMPADSRVRADNAVAAISDAKKAFSGNPEIAKKLGLNNWDSIAGEMSGNGVSWSALKQFRTSVGEALGGRGGALSDEAQGRLKHLYGALTQDMEAAAKAAGPEAYKAWTTANKHYRAGAARIERSLDGTISAKSPERAFEAFDALTKADRSTADLTRMRQIKSSLSRDEWSTVSASIVDRLGKARAGVQNADGDVFSPSTFLTGWNKLSPEAKRLLLPDDVRSELDKVAAVSDGVRAANLERNFSNTGNVAGLLAAGAGGATSLPITAAALAAANISARFMTSSVALRALNAASRGDARGLRAMANGRGPFARDASTLLNVIAAEQSAANADAAPSLRLAN